MIIRKKHLTILLTITCLLIIAAIISVMTGPVFIHPLAIIKVWLSWLSGGIVPADTVNETSKIIIQNIRMPRVVMAMIVGMGLAASGAAMQGLFRNPMAEPYVLGMSSGAAAGASLAIVLGIGTFLGYLAVPVMAFTGALTTIFIVYSLARMDGKVPTETLLLSGIAVGFFLQAIVSFLKLIASMDALRDVILWIMGSFAGTTWNDVYMVSIPISIGIMILFWMSRDLNALQFGEETAMHLGMNVEITKRILLSAVAMITALAVAVSGIIGFVGLIIPHIARMLVGTDHRIQLPVATLAGGLFLVFTDTLARTIGKPSEIPIGILTAAIGAPYFIYLLKRRKKAIGWW
jgi:iron complex transport system permease protein